MKYFLIILILLFISCEEIDEVFPQYNYQTKLIITNEKPGTVFIQLTYNDETIELETIPIQTTITLINKPIGRILLRHYPQYGFTHFIYKTDTIFLENQIPYRINIK